MNNQKLQNFIDLVTFDQSLIELESSIFAVKEKIAMFQKKLKQLEVVLQEKENRQKETKKQLDLQELEVKALQEKEQQQGVIVEKATNPREYDAANRELDTIKVNRDKQEKRLMQLWNSYEHLQKEVEEARVHKEKKEKEVQEAINQENEIFIHLEKDFAAQSQSRDTKIASVPSDWINVYEHMRGKVSNPVVPVTQESCSACFYNISSKDLQSLKQGELVQCKDCYRFLYNAVGLEDHSE